MGDNLRTRNYRYGYDDTGETSCKTRILNQLVTFVTASMIVSTLVLLLYVYPTIPFIYLSDSGFDDFPEDKSIKCGLTVSNDIQTDFGCNVDVSLEFFQENLQKFGDIIHLHRTLSLFALIWLPSACGMLYGAFSEKLVFPAILIILCSVAQICAVAITWRNAEDEFKSFFGSDTLLICKEAATCSVGELCKGCILFSQTKVKMLMVGFAAVFCALGTLMIFIMFISMLNFCLDRCRPSEQEDVETASIQSETPPVLAEIVFNHTQDTDLEVAKEVSI